MQVHPIFKAKAILPCTLPDCQYYGALDAALLPDTSSEATAASRGLATPTGQISGHVVHHRRTWFDHIYRRCHRNPDHNNAGVSARGNCMLFPPADTAVAQPERYTADPLPVFAGLAFCRKDAPGNTSQPTATTVLTARFNDIPDVSTPVYLPATAENTVSVMTLSLCGALSSSVNPKPTSPAFANGWASILLQIQVALPSSARRSSS